MIANYFLHIGLLDSDVFIQYVRLFSPLYQGIEKRILFLTSEDDCSGNDCFGDHNDSSIIEFGTHTNEHTDLSEGTKNELSFEASSSDRICSMGIISLVMAMIASIYGKYCII